jgi:histidinol-phosphate aminotransferase
MLRNCIDLQEYIPGRSIEEVKKRYGLKRVVKLASNENPYGASPKAIEAFKSFDNLHIYPNPEYEELRQRISDYTGWEFERIVIGAGMDGILEVLFKTMIDVGDEVIIPVPTFPYYHILTKLSCGREVLVKRGKSFKIDEGILDAIGKKTKLVIICSPNNPTGNTEDEEVIKAISESVNGLVFIDEAYVEFAEKPLSIDSDNVVVARTFSKAFGLANLRIGYARLPEWLIKPFKAASTPFPVSTPAENAAIAALEDLDWMKDKVKRIIEERERMYNELKSIVSVYPSQSNFLLFKSPIEAGKLTEELMKRGIIVRDCRSFVGCDNHIRVSVGKKEDNDFFLQNLREILT